MSSKASLIFMPDISGFTKFVENTAVEHSQHIISELLELLIDQNSIGLQLAEIEGDALFYYIKDDILTAPQILSQAKRMYQAFHKHLQNYEKNRICNCGACRTTPELELKFVVHGGSFDFIKVKESIKPFGADVIKAHRFLKNKVEIDEYILFSDELINLYSSESDDHRNHDSWQRQTIELDFGPAAYEYYPIASWKDNLHEVPDTFIETPEMNLLDVEMNIAASSEIVFEYLSNLKYRTKWNDGVDDIQYDNDRVNRAGTKHVCIIGNNTLHFETIKPEQKIDQLVYAERTNSLPGFKHVDSYFILKEDGNSTRILTKLMGQPTSFLTNLVKPFFAYKAKKQITHQLNQLKQMVERSKV